MFGKYIPKETKNDIIRKYNLNKDSCTIENYITPNLYNNGFMDFNEVFNLIYKMHCQDLEFINDKSKTITKISKYAFYNCSSLADIYIPKTVNVIDEAAFMGCTNLTIKCEATSKPSGWHDLWTTTDKIIWGA